MTRTRIAIFLSSLAATLFMTGLIWFVQIVHYPLFASLGTDDFARYAVAHSMRTSFVVVPVMLLEMATAISLTVTPPPGIPRRQMAGALAVLVVIWLSTAFVQVPRHQRLGLGFDSGVVATLVATNWIRTIGWTLRSLMALNVVARLINGSPFRDPRS